jgi:putative glutathione S-transferase
MAATTSTPNDLPTSWHSGPEDSFHGKITPDGPFKPEKDRYHLYIGLFCPFAHRASIVLHLKQLHKYAGIGVSVVKPYPKGNEVGWPGWQFNMAGESAYAGATEDVLFGSRYMHEIYFLADPAYKGRYSVPVLWDKQLKTIVNNESHELLRDLQTAFDPLLPEDVQALTLYPDHLRREIDGLGAQLQRDLNTGVYQAGFAPDQQTYEQNVPPVFAMLNKLEKLAARHGGPYLLGRDLTEVDVRVYCTLIRFDVVYVQHFKLNVGTVRGSYPTLYNWMRGLYWTHPAFGEATTDFRHIKENYTKSHGDINPRAITPVGPWPHIDSGFEPDWTKVPVGEILMPEVVEYEGKLG